MKSVMTASLVAVLALCLAAGAWAEDTVNANAATPAVGGDKPAAAPVKNVALDKTVADVGAQVTQAEKMLKLAEEELAKPEDKRDARKSPQQLKLNAALAYLRAAQKAKGFSIRLKEDERPAFLDQYDKPNREKAVSLLLELADAAKAKKAYADALAFYKEVLGMDPKNAAAEAGIKAILEEMKTAKATGSNNVGGSSDKTNIKDYQKGYKQDYSGTHTDWGRTGRSGGW
jgi:tetratricopeptide (TPR) repeat protein